MEKVNVTETDLIKLLFSALAAGCEVSRGHESGVLDVAASLIEDAAKVKEPGQEREDMMHFAGLLRLKSRMEGAAFQEALSFGQETKTRPEFIKLMHNANSFDLFGR